MKEKNTVVYLILHICAITPPQNDNFRLRKLEIAPP